jgi:Tol biopolymer transport system component
MPLRAGTRFGPFEIVALIGAGGMGEVYRARDTRLDRDVALKVLPADLTSDRDRIVRFEREAKTLASLNHPHIAHVYGLEDASSTGAPAGSGRALVMELVDGEDLSQRVARGPMPLPDVLAVAQQIADAIGSAHDNGIIHRDLKPSNIRVAPDGTVKVLDFGLAKALGSGSARFGSAPTTTGAGTIEGTILGTAAYMSPEQARGQAVDARSDVWAFGCILYEMLVGRRAFVGATASDTIAKILEREPDWEALPSSTPPSLRRVLARCLEKDSKRRLHALADARLEIDEALVESRSTGTRRGPPPAAVRRRTIVVAAVAVAALLAGAMWQFLPRVRTPPAPARVMFLTSYPGVEATPTLSPDGRQVAFSWDGENGDNEDIYVVIVGSDSPLRITSDAARDVSPAWKPDGTQIAFARLDGRRAVISVVGPLGDSEQKLAEFPARAAPREPRGANDPFLAWSPDGRWLAVSRVTPEEQNDIFLLAHDGSERRVLLPAKAGARYTAAAFSPKGDALAFVDSGHIGIVDLDPASSGHVQSPARRLTQYLGYVGGLAWTADGKELLFGRAAYASPTPSTLWRVAASGASSPERIDLAGVGSFPTASASGQRIAYSRRGLNVDMMKLQEGRERETIAASTFNEFDASFSPDGSKVAFASDRTGEGNEIWVANHDGSGRRPVTKGVHRPEGSPRWSPDGQRLAYDGVGDDGKRQVFIIDEAGGQIRALSSERGFYAQLPSWSRDGKWVYFESDRTGRSEVWRAPADGGSGAQQITTTGGGAPFESWDGHTLYFSRPGKDGLSVLAMPVAGGPERRLDVTVTFWNYVPGERGLYYASAAAGLKRPYTYDIRLLDDTGTTHVLYTVRLASLSPGFSVLADGKTVLIAGVAEIGQDLLRLENFR